MMTPEYWIENLHRMLTWQFGLAMVGVWAFRRLLDWVWPT